MSGIDALNETRPWGRQGVAMHLLDMGGQAINTASAMGRMFLTMTGGFAELERNLIAERTRTALQHKRDKGEAVSRAPRGLCIVAGRLATDSASDGLKLPRPPSLHPLRSTSTVPPGKRHSVGLGQRGGLRGAEAPERDVPPWE